MSLVPLRIVLILDCRRAPLALCADGDVAVAVGNILDDLLQESLGSALLFSCDFGSGVDGEAEDTEVRLEGLEIVVVVGHVDEEAVWQDGHGGNDVENDLADGLVDDGKVGDVGGIGEVEFDGGRVDEGDLSSSDLCTLARRYFRLVSLTWEHTKGITFVIGHNRTDSLPRSLTCSIPWNQ